MVFYHKGSIYGFSDAKVKEMSKDEFVNLFTNSLYSDLSRSDRRRKLIEVYKSIVGEAVPEASENEKEG